MSAPGRWIRLDAGWENSPWLDALDGTAAGCWPRVLCWVKREGSGGKCKAVHPSVVARAWRVPLGAVEALLSAAQEDGALVVADGTWTLPNWTLYQPQDATAPERMARYRASQSNLSPLRRNTVTDRNVTRNTVTDRNTPVARDSDSDVDLKESPSLRSGPKKARALKGEVELPAGWVPNDTHARIAAEEHVNLEREALMFRDHAEAHGRKLRDWDAGFRTWLRKATANGNSQRPPEKPEAPKPRYHMTAAQVREMYGPPTNPPPW